MASAFDGLGMGQLGFEKQFMTGDNPLREALKGLKTGMILQGVEASGLRQFLNPSSPSTTGQPVIPPAPTEAQNANAMVPPALTNPAPAENTNLSDELGKEFGLQSSLTFTSPNTFTPSPTATDTSMLQMASQPTPPPGNMNLPQYGKKQGGGGGINPMDVISKLVTLFV